MKYVGYGKRQYTGKTGVKEVASHVPVVIPDMRPLRRTNGSGGGGTLSESFPCGRQEISILPLWRDYASVCRFSFLFPFRPVFLFSYLSCFPRNLPTILSRSFPLHYPLFYLFLPSLCYFSFMYSLLFPLSLYFHYILVVTKP